MTEKKASRDIYVFSQYLNEVYRLYGLAGNQEIFTEQFRTYQKRMIATKCIIQGSRKVSECKLCQQLPAGTFDSNRFTGRESC